MSEGADKKPQNIFDHFEHVPMGASPALPEQLRQKTVADFAEGQIIYVTPDFLVVRRDEGDEKDGEVYIHTKSHVDRGAVDPNEPVTRFRVGVTNVVWRGAKKGQPDTRHYIVDLSALGDEVPELQRAPRGDSSSEEGWVAVSALIYWAAAKSLGRKADGARQKLLVYRGPEGLEPAAAHLAANMLVRMSTDDGDALEEPEAPQPSDHALQLVGNFLRRLVDAARLKTQTADKE